jgi:hypothetical protein
MAVHFLFASIPDFYLETNGAIDETFRQNSVATDQNVQMKKKR